MERSSDHNDLVTALAEVRPVPRDAFTRELDRRAAGGFPRRSPLGATPLSRLVDWIHGLSPRRLILTGGVAALAAIAIVTVVVADSDTSSENLALKVGPSASRPHHFFRFSAPVPEAAGRTSNRAESSSQYDGSAHHKGAETQSATPSELPSAELPPGTGDAELPNTSAREKLLSLSPHAHRDIERSAEIGLLAEPSDVAEDSAKVFTAVHDANGIVLHSITSSGSNGGARFELLIPSARLGDALAAFSSIDEVTNRHEATDDITKPTVAADEELQDSQARIDGLLGRLSAAETEAEREAIEAELRTERAHAAGLRGQLNRLHQRTAYSRVLVRIQSGHSTEPGGAWGIGDAFDDAGHILGIAAGVTLVGLAVIVPPALLCLLAWLARRFWLRTSRERALDG